MAASPTIHREWILAEFTKGIDAESLLQQDAEASAASPPDPSLGVLYHEIATANGRHHLIVQTIATRYGYNPGQGQSGGLGKAIGRLKHSVGQIGSTPQVRIAQDLTAKASALHWTTAWVAAFQSIGDSESARELAAVLTEQKAHHDALQEGLNRLVSRGVLEGE